MPKNTNLLHSTIIKQLFIGVLSAILGFLAIWQIGFKSNIFQNNTINSPRPVVLRLPEMIDIKGGIFDMGDIFNETSDVWGEKPLHTVELNDYQIGKYEVTFEEFDAFCEATNRPKPKDEGWGRHKQPVINVDWADATAFCQWLSDSTGKKYRLPTEAEWEYAARERGKKIRFGNGKNIANTAEMNFDGSLDFKKDYSIVGSYRSKTLPVDSLKPNGMGLYNMSGNVLEWCSDFYSYYKKETVKNPKGATQSAYRVIRGGSWRNTPQACRATNRGYSTPTFRGYYLGFRVALSK